MKSEIESNFNNQKSECCRENKEYKIERPVDISVRSVTLPDVPLDELPRGFFPGDKITIIEFKA